MNKSVSFSGYRPSKMPNLGQENSNEIIEIKKTLEEEIRKAINNSFDTFLVGMADGFDTYASFVVIKLKKEFPNIKLIAVLPFEKASTSDDYKHILANADDTVILSKDNNRGSYYTRNEYLVDNCSLLICYYDGLAGGTEYTIDYANKKNITVVNIAPKEALAIGGVEMFNNTTSTVRDNLERSIKKNSKLSIASACFSIYAYNELKKRLNSIEELRFIFTSPTFTTDKVAKEKREFYIPQLQREKSLYGTEFEVKIRNELTQKAIAKECSQWIEKKVTFKSNVTNEVMAGFINLDDGESKATYLPINGFTTIDIGCERGNNAYNIVNKLHYPTSQTYMELFNQLWEDKNKLQDVTDEVIAHIANVYQENSAEFIYFITLYNIFSEFLEDITEDTLPNEATGFKESQIWNLLYDYQKDAVLSIISKLEKYNGCILADSVGLGKTYTALSVVKYYENKNKNVLVLCPKKLSNNWNTYKDNYVNNPIAKDRLRYDVLFHSDLNRIKGVSNGLDLDRLNWSNYDLIVIDESHNFRNGGKLDVQEDEKQNRYQHLLNKVIKKGVKTKVLMLSATPVNNKFSDLKNQIKLAYEGDSDIINKKLNTNKSIDDIFKNAQACFNSWSKSPPNERNTEQLLSMLDFEFFEVLDSVTIARSRKHIEKYYDTSQIGTFPTRLPPISHRPSLTNLQGVATYNQIFDKLLDLEHQIYTPTKYILDSRKQKYSNLYKDNIVNDGFNQQNREEGIRKLIAINLMKRMESSVHSFKLTIERILILITETISKINEYKDSIDNTNLQLTDLTDVNDFDQDDLGIDELFSIGKNMKIEIADMDYRAWYVALNKDITILNDIQAMLQDITPEYDSKFQTLISVIEDKIKNPINGNNKKIIIFTAFSDTAIYLYDNLFGMLKDKYNLNSAIITGSIEGKSTVKSINTDLNSVLTLFSPISKDKATLMPNNTDTIDVLIATDCISEGQNLQDCDYLINYDIHWNPVRIIQRFGRIDRIGSKNEVIQLVNFWPDVTLDEYINLKTRVELRMRMTVISATGDDDYINVEEKGELEYRKAQLERLQTEVVDIEEMTTGISIMDLGLNDFRLDLLNYINNTNKKLDTVPYGMHAVIKSNADAPSGVIYILKNKNDNINIDNKNRIHPFYMVYIRNNGEIVCNHLSPKEMLDKMRHLCKGKITEDIEACKKFNLATNDGKKMIEYSKLLAECINSIIEVKEESDIDAFLSGESIDFNSNTVNGLDDFELTCFLVVVD